MSDSLDFSFSEDQIALRELVDRILDDHATPERLSAVEQDDDWFDRVAWRALADAGLLGVGLPESVGGSGGDFLESAIVLESVGRHVAPVPVLASIVTGAWPIAVYGDDAQRTRWVEPVIHGAIVLSGALQEPGNDDPTTPVTTADLGIDGWRLTGIKHCVPAAHLAERLLVPARTGVGVGVFLVDPRDPAVTVTRHGSDESRADGPHHVRGCGRARPSATPRRAARSCTPWSRTRPSACCLMQAGVSEQALRMTAQHVTNREQFGQLLASFQAVSQRAADAFIDTEAIRLTAWQAAWRLSVGLDADDEVAIAKFWAAEGGQRVAHAAQHLHGGVGADVDFPLRRYFTWAKTLELNLGSATRQLLQIGARLAAEA